jgi:DNA-binding NtrC family response regulator
VRSRHWCRRQDRAGLDPLQRALERHGFSVLPAADGAEALRWSEQHAGTIEIVVSDIVMPELNGIELSKRIREARPETKFLFVTGFGDQFPELREYGASFWKSHSFLQNSCAK